MQKNYKMHFVGFACKPCCCGLIPHHGPAAPCNGKGGLPSCIITATPPCQRIPLHMIFRVRVEQYAKGYRERKPIREPQRQVFRGPQWLTV